MEDLYSALFDEVLLTFKGKEAVLNVMDKNYKDKMSKTQKEKLDEQLKLIEEQKQVAELAKQKNSSTPFSAVNALDNLDSVPGNK